MSSSSTKWWLDDLTEVCVQFQLDLSCLVDGELEEISAVRAIAHLEECSHCREFFEDTRKQVRAHRELADPETLIERCSTLLGGSLDAEVESIELVSKLSTIFYQLGKAYFLNAIDSNYRNRCFAAAVHVGGFQAQGRGFIDGILESGRGRTGGIDWADARHVLNGKLEKITNPLEKARRLLDEAISADPMHEEARFYLAWLDRHEGKTLRAAESFRQLFRSAVEPANRAHAVTHLGSIYDEQGDYRKTIACFRWITISGLERRDPRFYHAWFSIGITYARLGDQKRSLAAFRQLLDRHPDKLPSIIESFASSPQTQTAIAHQPGFAEALLKTCPELFQLEPSEATNEEESL